MTFTKDMQAVINGTLAEETTESRELYLCMDNNGDIAKLRNAIIDNLVKKYKKGIYDKMLAIKAFYHLAEEENKIYKKEWGYNFSALDRFRAAYYMMQTFDPEEYI